MNLLALIVAQLFLLLMRYKSTRHIENSSEINEKSYENEFLWLNHRLIEKHQASTLKFIPLRVENRDSKNLANLCTQHPGLWVVPLNHIFPVKVQHYGPRIQLQMMGFRRIESIRRPRRPVLVELIRCTEMSAVTTASRGSHYSYFLINDSKDSEPIFYIAVAFPYRTMNHLVMVLLGAMILLLMRYTDKRYIRYLMESNEKDYEIDFLWHNHEFIEQHLANTLPFIPLKFKYRHRENLTSLCLQYPTLKFVPQNYLAPRLVDQFGPKIQLQAVGFRRVEEGRRPSRPLRVELVRCTERYAIITAGWGNYSYYLVKDPNDNETGRVSGVMFYIVGKFEYREEIPPADTRSSLRTEISRRNRSPGDRSRTRNVTFNDNVEVQIIDPRVKHQS